MTRMIGLMVALNKLDRQRLTPREILVLFAVKSKPGMNGVELFESLNLRFRSSVQNQVRRLRERGLIEDRRIIEHDLTPSDFHLTGKGEALLAELEPK